MQRVTWLASALALASVSQSVYARSSACYGYDGASIIATDGKFLGTLSGKYDSNSIFNRYGSYGSKYSSTSIWNNYGTYGGEYSSKSPFNSYSSDAPKIVKSGKIIGRLTTNKYLSGAVNPYGLSANCYAFYPEK